MERERLPVVEKAPVESALAPLVDVRSSELNPAIANPFSPKRMFCAVIARRPVLVVGLASPAALFGLEKRTSDALSWMFVPADV